MRFHRPAELKLERRCAESMMHPLFGGCIFYPDKSEVNKMDAGSRRPDRGSWIHKDEICCVLFD